MNDIANVMSNVEDILKSLRLLKYQRTYTTRYKIYLATKIKYLQYIICCCYPVC